jgi:hypothetical protein
MYCLAVLLLLYIHVGGLMEPIGRIARCDHKKRYQHSYHPEFFTLLVVLDRFPLPYQDQEACFVRMIKNISSYYPKLPPFAGLQ